MEKAREIFDTSEKSSLLDISCDEKDQHHQVRQKKISLKVMDFEPSSFAQPLDHNLDEIMNMRSKRAKSSEKQFVSISFNEPEEQDFSALSKIRESTRSNSFRKLLIEDIRTIE